MKVLYDHQIFSWQKFGGISRYFVELFKQFDTHQNNINFDLSLKYNVNHFLNDYQPTYQQKNKYEVKVVNRLNRHFPNVFNSIFPDNTQISKNYLLTNQYDILHPTYYDDYFVPFNKKPFVITVHDMIHEKFAEQFPPGDVTHYYKAHTIKKANRLIAISNKTKEDIIKIYDIDPDKIDVIYHGISPTFLNRTLQPTPNTPYLLFVGERGKYKNFNWTLKTIAPFLKDQKMNLVCFGGGKFTSEEIELIHNLNIFDRVHHTSGSDDLLYSLYKNAQCFLFPSIYEGFGLPILEAFSAQCPTLLSRASCFEEIAENSAFYFEPNDANSLISSLEKALFNPSLRNEKIQLSQERVKYFTWNKTAQLTSDTYFKCLKSSE